jgi:hypothetical protein
MNKRRMLILAAALLGGLALGTGALAQETASINWWVVGGGGGESGEAGKVVVNSTLGQPIIGPSGDKSVALGAGYWYGAEGPTAVTLASFEAAPVGGNILVEWETAMEIDTVGFNLYRSEWPGGPYTRLNASLIPGQALGAPFGAEYAWLDENVQPGTAYYYKLEDVEVGGKRTMHGPVSASAQVPTALGMASFKVQRSNGIGVSLAGLLLLSLVRLAVVRRRKRRR